MKKTIALTLLGLASAFALTTTSAKAEETLPKSTQTETNLTTKGDGIDITVGNLNFTEFTINTGKDTQPVSSTTGLEINVTDLRGTREGWQVSAQHDGLTYSDDTLTGATIALQDGGLSNNISESNAPTLSQKLSIGEGEASPISTAIKENGMGTWDHNWGAGNVILNIPAKEARDMYEGQYSTTITWTLASVPVAE
ncbi:WxL domain-containing protein [Aerococcaceae bacterium 50-4]